MNDYNYLQPGFVLENRYVIERLLGKGGFGNTYLAEDTRLDAQVAVKEFYISNINTRQGSEVKVLAGTTGVNEATFARFRAKFEQEARRISRLNRAHNQHIVNVTDFFPANGTSYYVMDFVEGEPLSKRVARGALPEAVVREYLAQILDSLDVVHNFTWTDNDGKQRHLLHLDIKPQNLMITPDNRIVLIDFGACKQMSASERQNTSSISEDMCYTPGYAPVEQTSRNLKNLGPWTDLYAVGATLYRLLTAQEPPMQDEILGEGEDAFDFTRYSVSKEMQALIIKLMSPSYKHRPQNVAEVRSLLANDSDVIVVAAPRPRTEPREQVFTVNGVSFKMIKVEHGTFKMGSNNGDVDEKPVHQVTLTNDYWIGETQVTQALWKVVMGDNPSYFKGDNLPIEAVSWDDCQEFIHKLNQLTGKQFRLPSEAEWEFAARGGNRSKGYEYSGSNTIGDVAWYYDNSDSKTHPVKNKLPNELGIYDMSGNVCEWCQDWYGSYSSGSQTNPTGPSSASHRVLRGGSWVSFADGCRVADRRGGRWSLLADNCLVAIRYGGAHVLRDGHLGFRLAL